MKTVLRRVVGSGVHEEKNFADDEYADEITDEEVQENIKHVNVMMGPLLVWTRLTDGQNPRMVKILQFRSYMGHSCTCANLLGDRTATSLEGSIERQILVVFLHH